MYYDDTTYKLDLSLDNPLLYSGCDVEEVAGRLNLTTPVEEAVNLVGRNIKDIIDDVQSWSDPKDAILLTGPMAVWSYLVVFHAVVHKFRQVYYCDGRSDPVLVAAHG